MSRKLRPFDMNQQQLQLISACRLPTVAAAAGRSNIMEHQQSVQSSRPRRRLDPFLRKPLWVVLGTAAETAVDGSRCTNTTYGTSSHGEDATNNNTALVLELPQRRNDRKHDEDCTFEYEGQNKANIDSRAEETNPTTTTAFPKPTQHQYQPGRRNQPHPHPPRHLSLFGLVSIGVGGTIGSGIFVLNGLIANSYAGPATFLSWTISGFAALLSGCCYTELSGRIPTAGSSYAYAFIALGELPAFVTFCMLTLEFLLSGSAVAR